MNRKDLLEMISIGTSVVEAFLVAAKSTSTQPSSYEDWNDADVVRHINGWMKYSAEKLSSIKLNRPMSEVYSKVSSLDEINEWIYRETLSATNEEVESDYILQVGAYLSAISLYTNEDINKDSFPTGFSMELWRYVVMDTMVHPAQHILFQLLKSERFSELVTTLEAVASIFQTYAEQNQAFHLGEFGIANPRHQRSLDALSRQFSQGNHVETFVRKNRA